MLSWLDPFINDAKIQVEIIISDSIGVDSDIHDNSSMNSDPSNNCDVEQMNLYYPFKLPIQYLPEKYIHPLSSIVTKDLELVETVGKQSVYNRLFKPSHLFGSGLIDEWKKQFTTSIQFLTETQTIIQETSPVIGYKIHPETLMIIWEDVKGNPGNFLEKYCYIEWDIIKPLNRSSKFLQILSMLNMMSPAISLMIPFLFLVLPFLLLKLRGLPISVSMYIDVLKDIAKHHFIGKALTNLSNMSVENMIYLVLGAGMYFYQIYQNITACKRFYRNLEKMNNYLYEFKTYLGHSIHNMEEFVEKHGAKITYTHFCVDVQNHADVLKDYMLMLSDIEPLDSLFSKLGSVGYMLQCYYELHSNRKYEESIRYSFGFEGFLDNLRGVSSHYSTGNVSPAKFDPTHACEFKQQYYPGHLDEEHCIKNDCDLDKKLIITGPNASGKTTMLKATTINVICSQQIGCGFYQDAKINPYTHIHSYLNIPDTSERDSLFQAESRRCKDIIDSINKHPAKEGFRHYGIFDELYSGTNPEEATKSGFAFLQYLSKYDNVDFILTTHYTKICSKLRKNKRIRNHKMDVVQDDLGKLKYTYKMKKGVSKIQGAVRILEDMDYPEEIINSVKNEK